MKKKRGQNYQPNLQLTSENVDSWIFFSYSYVKIRYQVLNRRHTVKACLNPYITHTQNLCFTHYPFDKGSAVPIKMKLQHKYHVNSNTENSPYWNIHKGVFVCVCVFCFVFFLLPFFFFYFFFFSFLSSLFFNLFFLFILL